MSWPPVPQPAPPTPGRATAGDLVLAVVFWLVTALTSLVVLGALLSVTTFGKDASAPPPPPPGTVDNNIESAWAIVALLALVGTFLAGLATLAMMITTMATKQRRLVRAEGIIAAICVVIAAIVVVAVRL